MHGGSLHTRNRRVRLFIAVALIVVGGGGMILTWAIRSAKGAPEFASLADAPDSSLAGTVAYLDWERDACLRVVPAAGGPTRTVTCFAGVNAGAGPELSWLDDGRVAVTVYGEWEKIVDVNSGVLVDVPAAQVLQAPPAGPPVNVGQDGRRLRGINDAGRVQIVLEQNGTSRILLDAKGGSTYEIGTPQWSPDARFVLTTDSAARLLVTTLGETPRTRVLATELGGDFAVTSSEF